MHRYQLHQPKEMQGLGEQEKYTGNEPVAFPEGRVKAVFKFPLFLKILILVKKIFLLFNLCFAETFLLQHLKKIEDEFIKVLARSVCDCQRKTSKFGTFSPFPFVC